MNIMFDLTVTTRKGFEKISGKPLAMLKQNSRCVDGILSRLHIRAFLKFIVVTALIAWTWLYSPFLTSSSQHVHLRTANNNKETLEETSRQNEHENYKISPEQRSRQNVHRNYKWTPEETLKQYVHVNKKIAEETSEHNEHVNTPIPYHREIILHPPNEECKKRLPKALIVGVQKCGTSALMYFLSFHPQIAAVLSPPEVMYFSQYYDRPLSWYKNQMKCSFSNQISMEKSPPYFYRPQCVDRIKQMDKDIKIIVIVKDPVVRALSAYAMMEANKQRTKRLPPFSQVVVRKGKLTSSRLIRWSEYSKFMDKWISGFDLKQIYVADGHALEDDPSAELSRVEEFLGIGSHFTADKFVLSETKGKQCFHHNNGQIDCLGSNKGRHHATIPPDVLQVMQRHFKPFNERFFNMVKKRFDWGY